MDIDHDHLKQSNARFIVCDDIIPIINIYIYHIIYYIMYTKFVRNTGCIMSAGIF